MANELIINASLPETRIALMENGEIQELLIERASGKGIVGNIYKGRVTRVLPGMQAAFVDIGLEKAAFLYVDDVYVHSEIWEEEEGSPRANVSAEVRASETEGAAGQVNPQATGQVSIKPAVEGAASGVVITSSSEGRVIQPRETQNPVVEGEPQNPPAVVAASEDYELDGDHENDSDPSHASGDSEDIREDLREDLDDEHLHEDDTDDLEDEDGDDDRGPVKMGRSPKDSDGSDDSERKASEQPAETIRPEQSTPSESADLAAGSEAGGEGGAEEGAPAPSQEGAEGQEERDGTGPGRRRHRRGRRGGRFRRKGSADAAAPVQANVKYPENYTENSTENYPEKYHDQVADTDTLDSDRSGLTEQAIAAAGGDAENPDLNRPENTTGESSGARVVAPNNAERSEFKAEFRSQRSRDRRIRPKAASRPVRAQVNIQDLLKEGQEVLVQVAKDPIATKGARLTCHISLPGRHLVCMPTIDHVGVSRRIEREDERRRLREYVERNRPRNLGFIVRTASGKQQSEKRIKQDIEYLTHLWTEIREKAAEVTAPALVYEDLNAVLRAIRDWVTEDIDKVIVDSRYHYNDIQRFVSHFMPPLKQKVELYHGDIPIFDAYGISTELSRALERKVWLKSGGYIVIDQAEALVAIDVNTGRYVGKKNLEDTILKTNLEAVQEIAYQLRLRNCGGIIILDLIDMDKDENKQRVYRALEDALSRDRARPTILKISELGLVEMTRKRTRDTIVRTLCESCTHCEGKGFIKAKATVAYEVLREMEREGIERDINKILVQAHPDVIDILAIDERDTLDQLEKKYRKQIYLQAVADFHPEQFEVTAEKKDRAERATPAHRENERSSHDRSDSDRNRNREKHRHSEASQGRASQESGSAPKLPVPLPVPLAVPLAAPIVRPVDPAQAGLPREEGAEDGSAGQPMSIVQGNSKATSPGNSAASGEDGSYDEEDRLAFLRAQAAQDAALARLGTNSSPHAGRSTPSDPNRGAPGGGGGGGGRRNARGGRRPTGKFRPRNERGRDRGPGKPGFGPNGPSNQRWTEPGKEGGGGGVIVPSSGPTPVPVPVASAPAPAPQSSGSGSSGGGDTGGKSGTGSGGGEHSQPPV